MPKLSIDEVLKYTKERRSQGTVKRHYIRWREQQDPLIPLRCDEPNCKYYTDPLIWNEKELNLVLDHINGVSGDNRPENLRFLCPNCNSQQPTHGGGNRGKAEKSEGGFAKIREDGKKDYTLPAETGKFE
jgi:5-methylcytosine-specific restriction endonuclease McrA